MFKLIGAMLVVLATTWTGFLYARTFRERPRQIRQLRAALAILETEINFGNRPLVQACQTIAARIEGVVGELFHESGRLLEKSDGESTYDCFCLAFQRKWSQTAMKEPERMILQQFAQTLGVSDREDQLQHLALAKTNLEVEEQKAREEQKQYEKMFRTVGVLAGVLIIILFY